MLKTGTTLLSLCLCYLLISKISKMMCVFKKLWKCVKISGYMYKFQDLTPISGHFRNFRTMPRPARRKTHARQHPAQDCELAVHRQLLKLADHPLRSSQLVQVTLPLCSQVSQTSTESNLRLHKPAPPSQIMTTRLIRNCIGPFETHHANY